MSPDIKYIVIINFLHAFEVEIDMNEPDIEMKVISNAVGQFNKKELSIKSEVNDYEVEKVWDIRLVIKE